MDKLRRIYQQAILIPTSNIELLWKDYDEFENTLSKITAKKLLGERSGGYMLARTVSKEIKSYLDPIDKFTSYLAVPPSFTESECRLLETWKRYISWEKNNPLNIDDANVLASRIIFAYKSALLMLRYFPEIWFVFF